MACDNCGRPSPAGDRLCRKCRGLKLADRTYVQTPVECREFIMRSVEYLLKKHFGKDLDAEGVRVLDPFAGRGEFLATAADLEQITPGGRSVVEQYEQSPDRAAEARAAVDGRLGHGRVRTRCIDTFEDG